MLQSLLSVELEEKMLILQTQAELCIQIMHIVTLTCFTDEKIPGVGWLLRKGVCSICRFIEVFSAKGLGTIKRKSYSS